MRAPTTPKATSNPRATLVVAILRRVVYTLLTLFRSVTQRSATKRKVAWRHLLADVVYACHTATRALLESLRQHRQLPNA